MRSYFKVVFLIVAISATLGLFFARPEQASATLVVDGGEAVLQQQQTVLLIISNHVETTASAGDVVAVRAGDVIQLGDNASARLRLANGTTVDLSPGTQLELARLDVSQNHQVVNLHLIAGSIYNRVQRLLGADEAFEVITPSSTASVRGTAFVVEIQSSDTVYYAVDEGLVRVQMGDEMVDVRPSEEVLAVQGESLRVQPQRDDDAPALYILSPLDHPTPGQTVLVRGRTEPGAQVTVAGQVVAVDSQGNFELEIVTGHAPIMIRSVDAAGNKITVEIETE